MKRPWGRPASDDSQLDEAEQRLRRIQSRADNLHRALAERSERNHWGETVMYIIRTRKANQ